jgi:hypothetical protein
VNNARSKWEQITATAKRGKYSSIPSTSIHIPRRRTTLESRFNLFLLFIFFFQPSFTPLLFSVHLIINIINPSIHSHCVLSVCHILLNIMKKRRCCWMDGEEWE